jgi:hypothetical protein
MAIVCPPLKTFLLVNSTTPRHWSQPMGLAFLISLVDFIVTTSKSDIWKSLLFPHGPANPPHRFTWECQNLWLDKAANKEIFKNLQIKIQDRMAEQVVKSRIDILLLVHENERPLTNVEVDMNLDKLRYVRLMHYLRDHDFDPTFHKVSLRHPCAGSRLVSIANDGQLKYAVVVLRYQGTDTIELQFLFRWGG